MFDLNSLMVLSLFVLAGYFVIQAIKLRESAQKAVEAHCAEAGVQLLDSTIVLRRLGLKRGNQGGVQLKREFEFEFTVTGGDRTKGWVRMMGKHVVAIELAPHRFQ